MTLPSIETRPDENRTWCLPIFLKPPVVESHQTSPASILTRTLLVVVRRRVGRLPIAPPRLVAVMNPSILHKHQQVLMTTLGGSGDGKTLEQGCHPRKGRECVLFQREPSLVMLKYNLPSHLSRMSPVDLMID